MQKRIIINLGLLFAILSLASLLYFWPKLTATPAFKLSKLMPDEIELIQIDRPNQPSLVFQKKANRWQITSPFTARADSRQIEPILAFALATPSQQIAGKTLTEFDLAPPLLSLTLNQTRFEFGGLNPITREQYLAAQQRIYLIPTYYFAQLIKPPQEFIDKRLFAENEIPIAFKINALAIERQGTSWKSNANDPLSPVKLEQWASQWQTATSILTLPRLPAPIENTLVVTLQNGKHIQLDIVQHQPLIVNRRDENLQYHFAAALSQTLLEPFALTP